MSYFFEENVPQARKRWDRPQASMDVKGEIQISPAAWEAMECPEQVVVMFDRASMTIALRAATTTENNSQKVYKKYHGRRVKAGSLLTQFELELDAGVRFTEVKVDDHGRLILPLGKAVPYWTGGRVGAFHNARKKKLKRQLPIRKKILELAKERFEEVGLEDASLKTYDMKNAAIALAENAELEARHRIVMADRERLRAETRAEREERQLFEKQVQRAEEVRRQWEQAQFEQGKNPYPPGTPRPDDRKFLNEQRRKEGKKVFE